MVMDIENMKCVDKARYYIVKPTFNIINVEGTLVANDNGAIVDYYHH